MTGREAVLRILDEAEKGKEFIDRILEATLCQYQFTQRNKRFIQELAYGITRLKRRLDYIIDDLSEKKKAKGVLRNVLRMGTYQILFMNRIPNYAAVDESVKLLKQRDSRLAGFCNALLRRVAEEGRSVTFPDQGENPGLFLCTYYSHPEWLVRRWLERYGFEQAEKLCQANNVTPQLSIRVNCLRTSSQELVERLKQEGVEVICGQYLDYVYYLRGGVRVAALNSFREGFFQVQDESAVLVAELLNARRGERILDLCAAPGGKSTHIAELMGDSGLVIAVDMSVRKLKPLIQNLRRLGIQTIYPVVADSRYFGTGNCDGVLLDVPCSGSGTLSRRPDLRWRKSEDDIRALAKVQLELLANGASLLKVGGRLVYSTCSIEPDENEDVVSKFLSTHREFTLEPIPDKFPEGLVRDRYYLSTLPHIHGIDGIFACLLKKGKKR